jgi:hypothetical protein
MERFLYEELDNCSNCPANCDGWCNIEQDHCLYYEGNFPSFCPLPLCTLENNK